MTNYDRALRKVRPLAQEVKKRPAKRAVDQDAFNAASDRYEAINGSLKRNPVRPAWAWNPRRRRYELAREFTDVPKRFLDVKTKPTSESAALGNIDDRAHEFGFADGDELREWMLTARRPQRSEFMVVVKGDTATFDDIRRVQAIMAQEFGHQGDLDAFMGSEDAEAVLWQVMQAPYDPGVAGRVARFRDKLRDLGGRCIGPCMGKNASRPGLHTCEPCIEGAKERVRKGRLAKRNAMQYNRDTQTARKGERVHT